MKPIHAALIVDLLEFICKVEKVAVTIKKIRMRYIVLLHHTESTGKTTKVRPIGLRKDAVE
jgi:hypothetical protein